MAKELTIPERLAWLLKERGVSQNALAKDAKVSPQTVANTLRHGRVPQARTINKFARTLGVSSTVFDAKRTWTEADLKGLIAKSGTWTPPGTKRAAAKKTTASKTTARKPAAKKAVAKKATAKKTTAKKAVAKKPVAKAATKKTVAKKAVAKPAAKKAVAKKTTARKPAAKKAVAKKTAVKKTVAKKATTTRSTAAKRPSSTKVVRHSSKGRTTPARKPATNGRLGNGVDYDAVVAKLQKLMSSRSEQVALDACKALLTLR